MGLNDNIQNSNMLINSNAISEAGGYTTFYNDFGTFTSPTYIWPTWPITTVYGSIQHNTFEQAFKMVAMLIEDGHIKEMSLKDFIKLVKKVEKEL
jgi:hypothetical protein